MSDDMEMKLLSVAEIPDLRGRGTALTPETTQYLKALKAGKALYIAVPDKRTHQRLLLRFAAIARRYGYIGKSRWVEGRGSYFWGMQRSEADEGRDVAG